MQELMFCRLYDVLRVRYFSKAVLPIYVPHSEPRDPPLQALLIQITANL
jgi:hypothetical protein